MGRSYAEHIPLPNGGRMKKGEEEEEKKKKGKEETGEHKKENYLNTEI